MEHPVTFALPEQHLEHDIVAILGRVDFAFQPVKPDLDIAFARSIVSMAPQVSNNLVQTLLDAV
jgi:hypothetical protein